MKDECHDCGGAGIGKCVRCQKPVCKGCSFPDRDELNEVVPVCVDCFEHPTRALKGKRP